MEGSSDQDILNESAMEFPWHLRLALKLRNWLVIRRDGSINQRMERVLDKPVPAQVQKQGVAAEDVVIDAETGVWVRVFRPAVQQAQAGSTTPTSTSKRPVMFYFHGGGFTMFSANSPFADWFGRYLSSTFEALVVSVDYRKTPHHPYPAAYDDCQAALRWAVEHVQDGDISRCLLVGESAGGNIVHHVAVRAAADPALQGRLRVVGNVALFPFFGGEERTAAELRLAKAPMLNYRMCDVAWRDFLPPGASRDHPAVNVAGTGAPDLSGVALAPVLVTVGDFDCLKEWQLRYVQTLRRSGKQVQLKVYKGGVHCFHVFPHLKLTAQLLSDVDEFIRSRLITCCPV